MLLEMAKFPSFMAEKYYIYVCVYTHTHTHAHTQTHIYTHHIFIHWFVDGHLSCFCILAIVNNDAVNTEVHVSFQIYVFVFFSSIYLGMELAGHNDSSIFSFLRNLHTVFHNGCINLCFHQQYLRIPFFSHPFQHLLFVFLFITLLIDVQW